MDEKLRQLKKKQQELMREIEKNDDRISGDKRHGKNELLEFFIGLVLLGGGLFWIFQSVKVTSSLGYSFFYLGGRNLPNGIIILPLLFGIVMLFMMKRKIFGWIVCSIGVLVILLTIMNSVRLYFATQSLMSYIFMFGFTAVGAALVLKNLFKRR